MNAPRIRTIAVICLKVAVTASLLLLLLSNVDLDRIEAAAVHAMVPALVLAIALHVLAFILGAVRWTLLMRRIYPGITVRRVLPSHFLGVFANNFLPTSIGGDAVRIMHLRPVVLDTGGLIAATLADRILGLIATAMIATGAMLYWGDMNFLPGSARELALFSLVALGASVLLLLSPISRSVLSWLSRRFGHLHAARWCIELAHTVRTSFLDPARVLSAFAVSIALQLLIVLAYFLAFPANPNSVPFGLFLLAVPITFIAASVPISLGGLGVREGVFVALLSAAGVELHTAILGSLLYLFVLLTSSLPGAAVLLLPRASPVSREHSQAGSPLP